MALVKKIESYMQKNSPMALQMGVTSSQSPEEQEKDAQHILQQLRNYKGDKKKGKERVLGAQFIIMYYTMKAMKVGMSSSQQAPGNPAVPAGPMGAGPMAEAPLGPDPKIIEEFRAAQKKDMSVAWDLLNIKFTNSDFGKAALMLRST